MEGGLCYGRPALSVRFGDEVRGIELRLDGSEILTEGNTIGSRTGVTGHFANPWFAVDDEN
ncbi:hypothetical protein [Actinopolymorpha pittospori]